MGKLGVITAAALYALWLTQSGCATRAHVASDYRELARETPPLERTTPTVVMILVDGLSVGILQKQIAAGKVPSLQRYFLKGRSAFQLGRAAFPSLTYPNISSILTARGIDQQPVIGNQMLLRGKIEDFVSPLKMGVLNREIEPLSVFTRLKERGETSVSLAQYFGAGAAVQYPRDIKSGMAYVNGDYSYIDEKAIDSANSLLSGTDPSRWPSLVFIHLVGVDAIVHHEGPDSKRAADYLARLDRELDRTFDILRGAEKDGKKVASFLTADHGFTRTSLHSNAESVIRRLAPEVTVINQSRYLALHFPTGWSDERKARLLARVRSLPGQELTMLRLRNDIWVHSATGATADARIRYFRGACAGGSDYRLSLMAIPRGSMPWGGLPGPSEQCPEAFDRLARPYYYPFFVSNAAAYFHAPEHPDAVVLAGRGVAYSKGHLGEHGGMTPEEILVPVLMRGAALSDPSRVIPTHKLLAFVANGPVPAQQMAGQVAPASESGELIVAPAPVETSSWMPRVPQELVLSSPVSRWWLYTQGAEEGAPEHTLSSDPTLGLSGEWHQYWNTVLSTSASYQFSFVRMHDSADALAYRTAANFRQEAFTTIAYHFGPGEKLIVKMGAQEQYFPHHSADPAMPSTLDKLWIPEIGFGSKGRLISLGIGDIILGGNLALLVPRDTDGFSVYPGFKKMAMVAFARPVGKLDTVTAALSIEHIGQNTSLADRSAVTVGFALSYGLTFVR
jgi:hypothetical protein